MEEIIFNNQSHFSVLKYEKFRRHFHRSTEYTQLSYIPSLLALWWCHMHLPASEFGCQFGEEIGSCPAAAMGQRAGVMMRQGGWSRRSGVHRGPAVPQLSSMKRATDGGAAGQAASVRRGRGGGRTSAGDAECGGRRCRHAVTQRATRREDKML